MAGYTKLFGSIVHSTIWREPTTTRIVWITMLALKDGKGDVHASVPGLADAARVTRPECEDALERLVSPDPDSSNKTEGGRRIIPIEGGWFVVSHQKYSRMLSVEERRERDAERKRVQRASANVRAVTDVAESLPSRSIPDPDPDPNPERDPERARKPPAGSIIGGGVARTYSLPSPEPDAEYIAEALMAGVPRVQAESTWAHYFGAGLPERGVERLNQWLVKRSKERQAATTKAERGGRKGDSVQPSLGKTGWETLEGKKL